MTDEAPDDELRPPKPVRVARRALVLDGLACRGLIESEADAAGAERLRVKVRAWWEDIAVVRETEPDELRLVEVRAPPASKPSARLHLSLDRSESPRSHTR